LIRNFTKPTYSTKNLGILTPRIVGHRDLQQNGWVVAAGNLRSARQANLTTNRKFKLDNGSGHFLPPPNSEIGDIVEHVFTKNGFPNTKGKYKTRGDLKQWRETYNEFTPQNDLPQRPRVAQFVWQQHGTLFKSLIQIPPMISQIPEPTLGTNNETTGSNFQSSANN